MPLWAVPILLVVAAVGAYFSYNGYGGTGAAAPSRLVMDGPNVAAVIDSQLANEYGYPGPHVVCPDNEPAIDGWTFTCHLTITLENVESFVVTEDGTVGFTWYQQGAPATSGRGQSKTT